MATNARKPTSILDIDGAYNYYTNPMSATNAVAQYQAPMAALNVPQAQLYDTSQWGNMSVVDLPKANVMSYFGDGPAAQVGSQSSGIFGGLFDGLKKGWEDTPWFGGVKDGQRQLGKFDYGLQTANSLMNAYMGMQGLSQRKKEFSAAKETADRNYRNSVTDYNNRMDGRAREMAAANPNFRDTYKRLG